MASFGLCAHSVPCCSLTRMTFDSKQWHICSPPIISKEKSLVLCRLNKLCTKNRANGLYNWTWYWAAQWKWKLDAELAKYENDASKNGFSGKMRAEMFISLFVCNGKIKVDKIPLSQFRNLTREEKPKCKLSTKHKVSVNDTSVAAILFTFWSS